MISLIIPPKVRSIVCLTVRSFKRLFVGSNLASIGDVDAGIRYRFQHQVASEQVVRARSHHQYPAASQAVQPRTTKRSRALRRYDLDG